MNNIYTDTLVERVQNATEIRQKELCKQLMIDTSPDSRDLPLVNEIFLIDPQTNQVHSVIRQIIPSGDKNVGELAMQQLKQHLENGDRQGHHTSKNSEDLSDASYEKEEVN